MTTDEEIDFGSMIASPTSFNLDFEPDKELPALNCVDLFPNPPKQIEISHDSKESEPRRQKQFEKQEEASQERRTPNANGKPNDNSVKKAINIRDFFQNDFFGDSFEIKAPINRKDLIPSKSKLVSATNERKNSKPTLNSFQLEGDESAHINLSLTTENEAYTSKSKFQLEEKSPVKGSPNIPAASPSLSISSCYSSAESVSSTSSSKKKKKKRYCQTCDIHFRHTHELLTHLRSHISLPTVNVEKLNATDPRMQDYLRRRRSIEAAATAAAAAAATALERTDSASGGLKLKFKLSGTQNFQVVPINKLTEDKTKKPVRILTAQEIKRSPPSSPYVRPLDAMVALSEMHSKQANEPLDNKYFECPTLDGLDQFAEEVNNEAAEELLKKLLEGNPQIPQDNDWSVNTNEFISIDRLAHICTVCHSNFPDAVRLYEHKRITGHDFQQVMHPPPPPHPHMGMHENFRPRMPYQPHMGGPGFPPGPPHPMNAMNAMRPNYPNFPPRYPMPCGPDFNQTTAARRPPPLYRVPNPQNTQPANMAPFAEMSREMYIPSANGGNTMISPPPFPGSPQLPQAVRQPIFLKARLQRALRPRAPIISGHPSAEGAPSPPMVIGQQTATRPRFLGPPFTGPPQKKIKREPGSSDCELISSQPRMDGMPIIQSVQGGAVCPPIQADQAGKDPIQLSDQITLSVKNKEVNKNPKEVANMLATRGITVTHKPKAPPSRESSPKNSAQEAVQKLQLNNSVSIISKKRPSDSGGEESPKPRNADSAFISCPVPDCEEKFLTQEGLNRHTQRGHKLGKINLKAFRCKVCPALFSTQEGLVDHQRKNHRILKTTADELGIPIVDLRNEQTRQKLASLGIINYIPLNSKTPNGFFAFPVVSVQGAANPNVCNMAGLGVNSLLSLGPIKQIPSRRMDS